MTLTINTNLPSLKAQSNLSKSTNALNKTIERMTTGFKINSSSDDAAVYSIVNNLTTQCSSLEVAESNTSMGIDLLNTASDTIKQMQSHGERLMALCIQARNGTYGDTSLEAIQSEANARVSEIARIYSSTEYNGINLLDKITPILKQKGLDTVAQNAGNVTASKGPNGKFIDDVVEETPDIVVSNPDELASAISSKTKIGIANAETLAKLAELVNNGTSCSGKTIILTEDIDLSAYNSGTGWTPIGNSFLKQFKGTFNGNGHVVSNLYINNPTADWKGLFGYVNGTLKNVGIENCDVSGKGSVGGLVGYGSAKIANIYVTGNVRGTGSYIGGLAGGAYSYTNCYTTGNVSTTGNYVGGLAGGAANSITNCYATGNISTTGNFVGGLVGQGSGTSLTITNSYATGSVSTTGDYVGGLAGFGSTLSITNSYATGNVSGTGNVGGLAGYGTSLNIANSYATGNVSGTGSYIGGLAAYIRGTITNSYATGNVSGNSKVGGLAGCATKNITNSVSFAKQVSGTNNVGSFVGFFESSGIAVTDCNCYDISGIEKTGNGTEDQNKGISTFTFDTNIQVGIYSDDNSKIDFDTSFSYTLSAVKSSIGSDESYSAIEKFMNTLNTKSTDLGAVTNRLDSAIDNITTSYDNLLSSRSTLRDSDIAEESSEYVKQQILQQASATLLSTANQSPSIVLSLI